MSFADVPLDLAPDITRMPFPALVSALALTQGLYPDERLFVASVPAERVPGDV